MRYKSTGLFRLRFLGILLGVLAVSASAHAQQTVTLGNATAELTWPWKFHTGDSPQGTGRKEMTWAQPGFDDSACHYRICFLIRIASLG